MNILQRNTIVKFLLFLIRKMPQSIPLTRNLSVEGPNIIVYDPWGFMDELLMEERTIEE